MTMSLLMLSGWILLVALVVLCHSVVNCPCGYEDSSGFHSLDAKK